MCEQITEEYQEQANNIQNAFDEIKEEAKSIKNNSIDKPLNEEETCYTSLNCKNCDIKKEILESKVKFTDPKAFAIKSLVDLFSHSEEGERAKGRTILLYFSLGFISIIFIVELIIIILQGLGKFQLETSIFLGTLTSITSAIIFTFRLISKYLYNNDKDKILETIEKLFGK